MAPRKRNKKSTDVWKTLAKRRRRKERRTRAGGFVWPKPRGATGSGPTFVLSADMAVPNPAESALLDQVAPLVNDYPEEFLDARRAVYRGWDAASAGVARMAAERALRIWPECIDARVLLAHAAEEEEEKLKYLLEAVSLGRKWLERGFLDGEVGELWDSLHARAYIRAKLALARLLWERGARDEAIRHARDLLSLDGRDRPRAREYLLPWLVTVGRYEEAEEVLARTRGQRGTVWMYVRALLEYRKHGRTRRVEELFERAVDTNRYLVMVFLAGPDQFEAIRVEEFYQPGSLQEAVHLARRLYEAYSSVEGALDLACPYTLQGLTDLLVLLELAGVDVPEVLEEMRQRLEPR